MGWKKNSHMSALLSKIGNIQSANDPKIVPDPDMQHFFTDELYRFFPFASCCSLRILLITLRSLSENEIFAKSRELEPAVQRKTARATSNPKNVAVIDDKEGKETPAAAAAASPAT